MDVSNNGGFSQPALPTAEVIKFAKDVKEDVEKAAKRPFPEYVPVLFCQQSNNAVPPGLFGEIQYHVKVQTGEIEYIQVRMSITTPNVIGFNRFLDHRTREDPIRPYPELQGGYSDVLLATPDIIHKAGELKPVLEKAIGANFAEFKAVLYCVQVVAGYNYMVKVQTSSDAYVHMKMFQGLPSPTVELISHEYPKTREDPLGS